MPRGSGVRFMVLVEDQALELFVRDCLLELGAHRREIRVRRCLAGRGSAKQWIDHEYPSEVQAHRKRASENLALVVGTDADTQTVPQRVQRLADTLQEAGRTPRTHQERIAIWVPKRNIETWLLFLNGSQVDEEGDYKNRAGGVDSKAVKAAAREFVRRFRQWVRDPDAATNLPSLVWAFEETKRIQQALDRASS
jgi:hypothetical protein